MNNNELYIKIKEEKQKIEDMKDTIIESIISSYKHYLFSLDIYNLGKTEIIINNYNDNSNLRIRSNRRIPCGGSN